MPLYYFDLYNDLTARDEEGQDLPDLDAARGEALRAARELMGEDIRKGALRLDHRIEIRDESGEETLTVHFADAVTIER